MKKTKLLVVTLLALLMVASLFVVAACGDDCSKGLHVDANHDGACDKCQVGGIEVVHTGGTATCTEKAVCTDCGQAYGDPLGHTGGEATCTSGAICTRCEQAYGEVNADNHKGGEATCTEPAVCELCEQPYGDALGHTGGDGNCLQLPVCDRCGEEYGDLADGHTGGEATCTEQAVCETCGEPYGDPLGHTGGEATCSAAAVCVRCEQPYGEIDADNHIGGEATCSAAAVCERCEQPYGDIDPDNHKGGTATCQMQAICELCEKPYGSMVRHTDDDNDLRCDVCDKEYGIPSYVADLGDFKAYLKNDLTSLYESIGAVDSDAYYEDLVAAHADGLAAIDDASSMMEAGEALEDAKLNLAACIPLADGIYSFTGLSQDEKTEILGLLEAYAIRVGTTGMTMFENGGYVMYADRVVLGTEQYIPGYGFGVLAEGNVTADLETENNAAWKRYYHTWNTTNPGTLNYMNDQGSEVADFYGYIGASYYTTFMNETKDGYDWIPELAAADPIPLNMKDGQATQWKFEIREGLKYSTLGSRTAYNNRPVAAEDFITPFKLMLNQANGYFRGGELAGAEGASAIVGAKAYYEATAKAEKGVLTDEQQDFSGVGVSVKEEEGKWFFYFELGAPVTEYYARYYISSSLYMPVPAEFIAEVGVDSYLGFNSDKTTTPIDNSLSLGAYIVEAWDEQQVVYKKNPNYVWAEEKYAIPGVHIKMLPAAENDPEAGLKEFLAGNTDSSGIPYTQLANYVNDPRTKTTTGDSCFKLNFNALDQETWIELFGENGSVAQTPEEYYWEVEPALGNEHFRKALSYAFNRDEFAAAKGSVSSVNYFSSNYMSDPENGIAYNLTDAHKAAVAGLLKDTTNGFSLELAREYFRLALDELEASGAYTPGSPEAPTVIELEVAWQYPDHEEAYHNALKKYWEDAFNHESVSGGKYKLSVNFWVGNMWSDVYYNKMMIGQFDIGFGSISGNPLDPLGFMEVLSSDPVISGSFTLNWGTDTNNPESDILVYNGMRWSYDALFRAATSAGVVAEGACSPAVEVVGSDFEQDADSTTATITIGYADGVVIDPAEGFYFEIFGYTHPTESKYDFADLTECIVGDPVVDEENCTITFTFDIPKALYEGYAIREGGQMIDVYWGYSIPSVGIEIPVDYATSVYYDFVK